MLYNLESCLSYVEAITGIIVFWLYFGMMMFVFCWYVEDYNFYSVNYYYFGVLKVWYFIFVMYLK